MSTIIWQGGAQQVQQVNTVTPANVNIGNTFSVVVNGKTTTFVATAATVANVTAGLVTLLSASTEPDVAELTYVDSTTLVTITGPLDGTPFTQTSSATGGTATNTTATPTAAGSPYHWSVAKNWVGGVVPVAADDVVIDNSSVPIKFGLDQSGTGTLTSLTIGLGFTGTIGLPERNPLGYSEYRGTYLRFAATTVQIGQGGSGGGSSRIKWDGGSVQTTMTVYATGQPADANLPAMLFKGTHASNAVSVIGGSVGLACQPGEVSTVLTLRVGGGQSGNISVVGGSGLTLGTLNQEGGTVTLAAGVTTVQKPAGTLTVTGSGACTTLNNDGGTLYWNSTGTITTLNTSFGATTDFRQDTRAKTVTTSTLQGGCSYYSDIRYVTHTNPLILNRVDIPDLANISLGTHITLTIAAGA